MPLTNRQKQALLDQLDQKFAGLPASALVPTKDKAAWVRSQRQHRPHRCHWPGCKRQVPPAMWGCRQHWFALPAGIRSRIWAAYRPGQELDMRPSWQYLEAAQAAEDWIKENAR